MFTRLINFIYCLNIPHSRNIATKVYVFLTLWFGMILSQKIRVFKKRIQISQKKWNSVQNESLRIINSILTIISRLTLTQKNGTFSENLLEKFPEVPDRIAFYLTDIINHNISELNSYIQQFTEILNEMKKIEKEFKQDFFVLIKKQVIDHRNPSSLDLEIIEQAEETIQEIVDMYQVELALRNQIFHELQNPSDFKPARITANLVLWSAEVYIESSRIRDLFEGFSLVEKLCEKIQTENSLNSLSKS